MNVIFIVQRGELELKALLLAWSLRQSHGKRLTLFAACPDYADWGEVAAGTRAALQQLAVQLVSFTPEFAPHYPIGNKVGLLKLLPEGEPGMFLDSDMLSLQRWQPESLLADCAVAAKPADVGTWGDEQRWQQVYSLAGLDLPERRVRLTVSGQLSLPYFNAGVVAARKPEQFGPAWLAATRQLHDCDLEIGERYPWLDQIALPIAMAQQETWRGLDEAWNFPAHLRALGTADVNLCHYHHPGVILREPRLRHLFRKACKALPYLADLASKHEQWQPLLKHEGTPWLRLPGRRDFLITGIPRSGTSLLCNLLDGQSRWLVVNEPVEVFDLLAQRPDASGLGLMHAQLRERIFRGEPIFNKVDNGKVVSDTALRDERVAYHPQVGSNDFWLGSKNTLVYLAALPMIRELNWPVVATVRHPLDSLASWRNTFDHLREARVDTFAVANPAFKGWSNAQRAALAEITCQPDAALRRVLLWRLLARVLLDNAHWLKLWRYEDLTTDVAGHVRQFNRIMGYRGKTAYTETRNRRRSRDGDVLERQMLGDLCAQELRELKYEL